MKINKIHISRDRSRHGSGSGWSCPGSDFQEKPGSGHKEKTGSGTGRQEKNGLGTGRQEKTGSDLMKFPLGIDQGMVADPVGVDPDQTFATHPDPQPWI